MTTENNDVLKERDDWPSAYPPEAQAKQRNEAVYLFCHFAFFLLLSGAVWWFLKDGFLGLDSEGLISFKQYLLAWSGGTLGGTAFSLKWFYHAIAKKGWHEDRKVWRFCAPHLSGLFAVALFALLDSGLLNIIVEKPNNAYAFGFGFIVGYFSDHAAKKLRDIADGLFGKPEGK